MTVKVNENEYLSIEQIDILLALNDLPNIFTRNHWSYTTNKFNKPLFGFEYTHIRRYLTDVKGYSNDWSSLSKRVSFNRTLARLEKRQLISREYLHTVKLTDKGESIVMALVNKNYNINNVNHIGVNHDTVN